MRVAILTALMLLTTLMASGEHVEAQSGIHDVPVVLPQMPATGISGFVIKGTLPDGIVKDVRGDINGNGKLDFADVVDLFGAVISGNPIATTTPAIAPIGRIANITTPDYGIADVQFTDTTFTVSVADGNGLLEAGGGPNVTLFTLQVEELAKGHTVVQPFTVRIDDDNGDTLPDFNLVAHVVH